MNSPQDQALLGSEAHGGFLVRTRQRGVAQHGILQLQCWNGSADSCNAGSRCEIRHQHSQHQDGSHAIGETARLLRHARASRLAGWLDRWAARYGTAPIYM